MKFIKVYGDSSPSFSTIKKCAAGFKCGCSSLEDDPHEGHPKSATTPEIIEQVHDMVLDDRHMKVSETAETIGISKECVGYILHEGLDMKKLCARWVLLLLTADQKRTHMKNCEQCLESFNRNKTDFVALVSLALYRMRNQSSPKLRQLQLARPTLWHTTVLTGFHPSFKRKEHAIKP